MKKHFILLGKSGLIINCWILIILFISLIFFYEKNNAISVGQLLFLALFLFLLIITVLFSYWDKERKIFKVPYLKKISTQKKPKKIWQWHCFLIYELKPYYQKYYFLTIEKRRK